MLIKWLDMLYICCLDTMIPWNIEVDRMVITDIRRRSLLVSCWNMVLSLRRVEGGFWAERLSCCDFWSLDRETC